MKNTTMYMNELLQSAKLQDNGYVERTPPSEWAQSLDDVFIRVKFAQRHDIPGCINYEDLDIKFGKDRFTLSAFCSDGDLRINYVLDFQTWDTISVKKSSWEKDSVGGLLINLKKNPS